MCANKLIDKLSSVEQASQTRRIAGGNNYGNLDHNVSIMNSYNDKNNIPYTRNDHNNNYIGSSSSGSNNNSNLISSR